MITLLKKSLSFIVFLSVCAVSAHAVDMDSLLMRFSKQTDMEKARTGFIIYNEYYKRGQIDSSLSFLDSLISIYQQTDSLNKEASMRWTRVAILNNSARFEQLEQEAVIQMEWFKKHEMWDRFYQTWQRKCSALHDRGKVKMGLQESHKMFDDATKRDNNIGRAMAYKQMGLSYYDMKQYEEASDAFLRGISLMEDEGERRGMTSGFYDFLCKSYDKLKKYNEALEVSNRWLAYLNEVKQQRGAAMVDGPLCSAYIARTSALLGLNRDEQARETLDSAEMHIRLSPNDLGLYYIYLFKASNSLRQSHYAEALAWTDSIIKLEDFVDHQGDMLRAEALVHLGRADEAASLYKQILADNDSIYGHDMQVQLSEMNTLLHVDELKMQTKLQQSRFIIEIGVIIIVMLILLFVVYYHSAQRLKKEHRLLLESLDQLEQSNAELTIANARAEESSKMKTDFIQQVSHEIRTPLNVLSGFVQVVTTPGMTLDEDTKKDISKRIVTNTNRITELVNKMLELSEINSRSVIDRTDTVYVAQLAAQAVSQSCIEEQEGLNFDMSISNAAEQTMLLTQESAVIRILVLMLHNARKFTMDNHTKMMLPNAMAQLLVDSDGRNVTFTVEDNGKTIPAEEAEHIFEEFVQLDEYADGMGIGLTVARSLARRLGGDVTLDTSYNPGARFVLTLPL
ncbi:MAG: hypothetical protein IKO17_01455 [Prevotella sp.]|nr:hypothetical protein [Prevotella sp.]